MSHAVHFRAWWGICIFLWWEMRFCAWEMQFCARAMHFCARERVSYLILGLVVGVHAQVLDLLHDRHALDHLAEHHVLAVQVGGGHRGHEELRAVGVGAGVGHAEHARLVVLVLEVLIREGLSVDGLPPGAVALGEVAALGGEGLLGLLG